MNLTEEEEFSTNRTYSIEAEDLLAERLVYKLIGKPESETGVYVDIGAYDPLRASNTHLLYKRGWHGLNVEPNPDQIQRFLDLRPRDKTINIGISEMEGSLLYTKFKEPLLNGFLEPKWVECHVRMGAEIVSQQQIPVAPASKIIAEQLPDTHVDLLDIDVELLEMEVLRSLDFDSFRPSVIVIELHGPVHQLDTTKPIPSYDVETISRTKEARLLKAAGYAFFSRLWHSSIFLERSYVVSGKISWWNRWLCS